MKAWQCDDSRPIPGLVQGEVEMPQPGHGELLIRVHAVGVIRTELSWYPTTHVKSGENRRHAIPGHEFSGVVAGVGSSAEGEVGQEVFGMNDWFAEGATAEFSLTLPNAVAPKPAWLTHAEAASVPISALTAWQGLFDRAKLQSGERVLIHGGAGAVGVFAIQLACWRGAYVLTTASCRDRDFLLHLGSQQVIDHRTERFGDVARRVDVVFDAVGGSTLQRSWDLLDRGGRLVTIASTSESANDDRTKLAFFIVELNRWQLGEIARLLESGQIKTVLDVVVPFDQAALAYSLEPNRQRGPGKTVISVISSI